MGFVLVLAKILESEFWASSFDWETEIYLFIARLFVLVPHFVLWLCVTGFWLMHLNLARQDVTTNEQLRKTYSRYPNPFR